jgi:hypothetical protein
MTAIQIVEYRMGYPFSSPDESIIAGVFCQATNHFFSRSQQDFPKDTFALIASDSARSLDNGSIFYAHVVEAFPIYSNSNSLMKDIAALFDEDIRFLRNRGLRELIVVNGKTVKYDFLNPGSAITIYPEIQDCLPISDCDFEKFRTGFTQIPLGNIEDYLASLLQRESPESFVGAFI